MLSINDLRRWSIEKTVDTSFPTYGTYTGYDRSVGLLCDEGSITEGWTENAGRRHFRSDVDDIDSAGEQSTVRVRR